VNHPTQLEVSRKGGVLHGWKKNGSGAPQRAPGFSAQKQAANQRDPGGDLVWGVVEGGTKSVEKGNKGKGGENLSEA